MLRSDDIEEQPADKQPVNQFTTLPKDAALHVFSFLSTSNLPSAALTDRRFADYIASNELWQRRLQNDFGIHVSSTVDARAVYREAELLIEYTMASVAEKVEWLLYSDTYLSEDDKDAPFDCLYYGEGAGKLSTAKSFWNRHVSVPEDLQRTSLFGPCAKLLSSLLMGNLAFTPVEWDAYMALGSQVKLGYSLVSIDNGRVYMGDVIGVDTLPDGLEYRLRKEEEMITGMIPWEELPADFPRSLEEILANRPRCLNAILTHTASQNLTREYNAVYNHYCLNVSKNSPFLNLDQLKCFGEVSETRSSFPSFQVQFAISDFCKLPITRAEAVNAALLSELLHNAAALGCDNIIHLMLSKQSCFANFPLRISNGQSMLDSAVLHARLSTAHLLLKYGAGINAQSCIFEYVKERDATVTSAIESPTIPLMVLIFGFLIPCNYNKHVDLEKMLDLLMQNDANVDVGADDPLSDLICTTPREVCLGILERKHAAEAGQGLENFNLPFEDDIFTRCLNKIAAHTPAPQAKQRM